MSENLIKKKFNCLTVIKLVGKNSSRNKLWLCVCDCGKETIVLGNHLKSGHTKSCGCLRKEKCKQLTRFGEEHPNWKNGKQKSGNGYLHKISYNHPLKNRDNCIYEHRLVMENFLGRYLDKKEVVHHINGNKTDNRIENLMLFKNNSEHIKFHKLNKYVRV